MKSSPFRQTLASAVVACTLLLAAPLAPAQQYSSLPRLGDEGSDQLSPAMERQIGQQIVRDMRRERLVLDDAQLTDWLNAFAGRLASTRTASAQSLELFLVNDGSLNAFALPGGFIGVHTGLIVAAQSESELASVLAHEIGHVTQRHIARMLAREKQSSVVMLASLVLAALAASSNPQAAMGVASLGSSMAQQQMLGFSRDAEREADRIGLDMLREAGYDANGMVSLLGRLQRAGRLYETGAPDYLRTHPVTSERIADIQNRITETRYRQRLDGLEFRLAQTRLRALADPAVDGLARAATSFERQLKDRTIDEAAGWFGLATVRVAQRNWVGGREAINETRARTGAHPFVERLAVQLELEAGDVSRALQLVDAAIAQWPSDRGLMRARAVTLLARSDNTQAARFLASAVEVHRADPELWRLQALAWNGAGDTARAHVASAEQFVLLGALPSAIQQLELARKAGPLDFYTASEVDARLRQLRAQYLREQQEMKGARR